MTMRSTMKKLAAGAAIGAAALSLGAGAAAAGPFDFPPPPLPGPGPIPIPTAPADDTDMRPTLEWAFCGSPGQVWVDFEDPDGPDLQMDVEVGYYVGRGRYEVHTMRYYRSVDKWIASVPDDARAVVAQATDRDGNYSLGVYLKPSQRDCAPNKNHFGNDQDVDIFGPEAIGAR